MKKVLDKDLEKKITGMKPAEVIELLRELQDGSGIKICQNVTKTDAAYREVK
jgi:hypothetical protein